jgi:hypothetical protein
VGLPIALPSFFQTSQLRPPSVKRCGSIEPPSPAWQTSGPVPRSWNGPSGRSATATEMHWRPTSAALIV